MFRSIAAIATNTFRETIRDRVLYSLLAFALLVIAVSLLAASVSLGQDERVIKSFGLTAFLIFLLLITIFIGTQLVYREIERKTIYLILSKPVSREAMYLGKFLGLCLTILVASVIMGTIFGLLLYYKTHVFGWAVFWAIFFTMTEAWLVTAIGMLFSSFTAPIASAVYTFCLVLIGHSSANIWSISQKATPLVRSALEFVYYFFPNLEKFNFRNEVIYNLSPSPLQITLVILYFLTYTFILLLTGMAIFRKNEF